MDKFYYFDEKREPQKAKNNVHALYLAAQGEKMFTKEEAQRIYLEEHQPKKEAVKETPKAEEAEAPKATPKKKTK